MVGGKKFTIDHITLDYESPDINTPNNALPVTQKLKVYQKRNMVQNHKVASFYKRQSTLRVKKESCSVVKKIIT